MSTEEIKSLLKVQIETIDDKVFLEELSAYIIGHNSEEAPLKLTSEQLNRVDTSIAQIERGEFMTNEEVEKMFDLWLKK